MNKSNAQQFFDMMDKYIDDYNKDYNKPPTGTFTVEPDVAKELLKAGAKEVDGFIMPYGEYAFAPPDPNEPEHPPIQSENEQ